MKKIFTVIALVASVFTTQSFAQKTKMVGGAAMYPKKDIVDNAVNSKDHTTLVVAVKAAGLVETLKIDRSIYGICTHKCGLRQIA